MSGYFVTGSGTDIGKTFAACGLLYGARLAGAKVHGFKPVAAGISKANEGDVAELLEACGQPAIEEAAAAVSPWRFKAALSPNMAAALEHRSIDFNELAEWSKQALSQSEGLALLEGVGGLMVPLDDRHTVRDWMATLGFPVILVTGNYLGALNHTLMTLELLRTAKLQTKALIVSESEGSVVSLDATLTTLKQFARDIPLIIAQPRVSSWKEAKALHALGEQLL